MFNPLLKIKSFILTAIKNWRERLKNLKKPTALTLDKKLISGLLPTKIPNWEQLQFLSKVLSRPERFALKLCGLIIVICLVILGAKFYFAHIAYQPAPGGEYIEGLIGNPQYLNPILSQTNDMDMDLSRLLFSGLLKYNEELELVPDLALRYEASSDQKTYTFYLRQNVQWHDAEPFSAADVIFTFESIRNPQFHSPLYFNFEGVKIEKVDDYTVKFVLGAPFTSFLNNLTNGIIPRHLWEAVAPANASLAEYNRKPIGTGSFQFKSLVKDKRGSIKSYTLEKNPFYYGQKPYLEKITLKFYSNIEEALDALLHKNIQGISFLPKRLREKIEKNENVQPRMLHIPQFTAVFFNQRANAFLSEITVRRALLLATPAEKLLQEVLGQEGSLIAGPLPENLVTAEQAQFNLDEANKILNEAKWQQLAPEDYFQQRKAEELKKIKEKKTDEEMSALEEKITEEIKKEIDLKQPFFRQKDKKTLSVALTTTNHPENIKSAEIIKEGWQGIGIRVDIKIISSGLFQKEIIKPRDYEALLFSIVRGPDPDPFPLWHSSQIWDPGLNLALFSNRDADQILEEARKTSDPIQHQKLFQRFQNILQKEIPAIFLYSPTYTYVISKDLRGFSLQKIAVPPDRFIGIEKWYLKTERTWR